MVAPLVLILFDLSNKKDLIAAEKVYEQLQKKYTGQGFTFKLYWNPGHFSLESHSPHDSIEKKRQQALLEAAHIVMLFSLSFIKKYREQPTWELAVQRDAHFDRGIIIPICMENCDASVSVIPKIPTFHKLFDLYQKLQHGTPMSADTREGLYEIFDEALAKSVPASTALPTSPTPPASIQVLPDSTLALPATLPASPAPLLFAEPFFPDPHYPDDRFFNAPIPSPYFVGEKGLAHITQAYRRTQSAMPGTPNIFVLVGLGGCGKTQLAVEYAYRAFTSKLYRDVLWVYGGTGLTVSRKHLDEMVKLLLLELHQKGKLTEIDLGAESLKLWLQKNQNWLLVFDEIDDISHILDYLPSRGNGHVLVTTCNQIMGSRENHALERMDEDDAILFLLKRARKGEYKSSDVIPHGDRQYARLIVQAMQYFPLAIDQVGAFIDAAQSDLKSFVENYLGERQVPTVDLLAERGGPDRYHPLTLVECWQNHFRLLQKAHPIAADILLFCAFFNPQGTYHKIIIDGHHMLGPQYEHLPRTSLDSLVIQLRRYSLIQRGGPGNEMLVVHPLLSLVLLDQLTWEQQYERAQRTIRAVHMACFRHPDNETDDEERKRWVDQLKVCETLIEEWQLQKLDDLKGIIQQLMQRKTNWQ